MIRRRKTRGVVAIRVDETVEGWKGTLVISPSLLRTLARQWPSGFRTIPYPELTLYDEDHNIELRVGGKHLVSLEVIPGVEEYKSRRRG